MAGLRAAWLRQAAPDSDRDLVERFAGSRDQAAFSVLFDRHAGMVLEVCWRVLRNSHDAEDDCQATFLVFARKAAAIRKPDSVASWLHGVALRVARTQQGRRLPEAPDTVADKPDTDDPAADAARQELSSRLDAELGALPQRYRAPLVLCYLEGKSREETARILGWSAATLHGRLERGRRMLRGRLVRRGFASAAGLVAGLKGSAALAAPARLAGPMLSAATAFAVRETVTAANYVHIVALAEGVLNTMARTKLITTAVICLALVLTAGGLGALAHGLANNPAKDAGDNTAQNGAGQKDAPGKEETLSKKPMAPVITAQNAAKLNTLHVLLGHQKSVTHMAFAPGGQLAATGDEGGAIILWEPAAGKLRAKLPAHRQRITALGFTPDGQTLLSISTDAVLKRWDVSKGREMASKALPIKGLQQAAFSPDGTSLATTHAVVGSDQTQPLTGEIDVWDTVKGVKLRKLPGHSELTKQLFFSADGATLFTFGTGMNRVSQGGVVMATSADTIKLWNFKEGKERESFPLSGTVTTGLSADAKLTALAGMDLNGRFPIQIVDLAKGKLKLTLTGHKGTWGSLNAVDFSPDGSLVATSSADKTIKLWNAASGEELCTLKGHTGWVSRAAFAPDGNLLVSIGRDNTVRVWGLAAGGKTP